MTVSIAKRKRTIFAAVCSLAIIFGGYWFIEAIKPHYVLEYCYQPGTESVYVVEQEVTRKVLRYEDMSMERHMVVYEVHSKVLAVREDGAGLLEESYVDQSGIEVKNQGFSKEVMPYLGATVRFWAAKNGDLLEIESFTATDGVSADVREIWKNSRFRFPEKPVAKGQRWHYGTYVPAKFGDAVKGKTEAALLEIKEESDGHQVAVIEMRQNAPIKEERSVGGLLVKTTGKISVQGTSRFDLTLKRQLGYEGAWTLQTASEVTHPDGKVVLVNGETSASVRERSE